MNIQFFESAIQVFIAILIIAPIMCVLVTLYENGKKDIRTLEAKEAEEGKARAKAEVEAEEEVQNEKDRK